MKNIVFRILLAVYAFCLTLISLVVFLFSVKIISFQDVNSYMISILNDMSSSLALSLASLVFFSLSIVFLLSGVRSERKRNSILKYSEIGEIRISLNTLENVALAAARKIAGLRDTKAIIRKNEEQVTVEIVTAVIPDINIPSVSEEIQEKVKSAIEKTTGVQVNEVKVFVENVNAGYNKPRVE